MVQYLPPTSKLPKEIPFRGNYHIPPWKKGKSSSKVPKSILDMLVFWRVCIPRLVGGKQKKTSSKIICFLGPFGPGPKTFQKLGGGKTQIFFGIFTPNYLGKIPILTSQFTPKIGEDSLLECSPRKLLGEDRFPF